ncbi:MBL fold metallo-hydrolase [Microvirga alba]|uniref:MBL fold metallo-hydrolase n=1 Tax=Microvirga alba TaxID=2791025 RepID=A0A931BPS9_9HYPH|nr:MBL fold metallo-hydrolase [Microvirga alba]MBF9233833.1 MBL fold metallo-hydrolase [Microvirga alba]
MADTAPASSVSQIKESTESPVAKFYRYRLGAYHITAIFDGCSNVPLTSSFVLNATQEEVSKALAVAGFDSQTVPITFTPIVVELGSRLVVIDTGTGEANLERSKGLSGQFQMNLAAAGIDRNAIDTVVISHFHGDHVNGLLTADGERAFPNAEILAPSREWSFWMNDDEMRRASTDRMKGLFANNRRIFDRLRRQVTLYDWDDEIAPGIVAVGTPGHSPGHTSYLITSEGNSVFIQSDVTNVPALFACHPEWQAAFDYDPEMAVETRRRVYDMLSSERILVQGFHFPFPGVALIDRTAEGYRAVPVDI